MMGSMTQGSHWSTFWNEVASYLRLSALPINPPVVGLIGGQDDKAGSQYAAAATVRAGQRDICCYIFHPENDVVLFLDKQIFVSCATLHFSLTTLGHVQAWSLSHILTLAEDSFSLVPIIESGEHSWGFRKLLIC